MLNKLFKLPLVSKFGVALALGLVVNVGFVPANASASDFTALWEAADAERKAAAAVGFEWRDTKKMLKQAKKASESGDIEKALKLVAQAHEQARDAIAQQKREAELWEARVPK